MITLVEQTVTVVASHELGGHRDAWDALALESPVPSPFLQSWWLEGTGGPRDHYLLVLAGDTLIGGLALERHRVLGVDHFRTLSGGKLCPDHIDLVARPDRVEDVVAAIRRWFTRSGTRIVDLDGVVDDSHVVHALAPARVDVVDVAPHEELAGGFDDYMAARTKSCRKRIHRFQRATANAGLICRRLEPGEIEAGLDDFEALHAVREDRQELVREIARIRRAALLGAARDHVRLYVGEREGRPGAIYMVFTVGGRFSTYQAARSLAPEFNHVGTVVEAFAIEDACRDRMTDLDLLRGDEPYKSSLVSKRRRLHRVRAAHGLRGRAVLALLVGGEHLRGWLAARVRSLSASRRWPILRKFPLSMDQTASGQHQ